MKKILLLCASLLVSGVAMTEESKSDGCSEQEQKTNVTDMESTYKLCSLFLSGESLERLKSNIEKSKSYDQKICKVTPEQQIPTANDFAKDKTFQVYQKFQSYLDSHNGSMPKLKDEKFFPNYCSQEEERINKIVTSQIPPKPQINPDSNALRKAKSIFNDTSDSGMYCGMLSTEIQNSQRLYDMAYHGQMTLTLAEEYVNGAISNHLGDDVTMDILIHQSYKAKNEIFQGHDSQDEMLNFTNSLFNSCKKNYATIHQGYMRDRNIDYSQIK